MSETHFRNRRIVEFRTSLHRTVTQLRRDIALVLTLLLTFSVVSAAQPFDGGTVEGTVSDEAGARIAGARVALVATGRVRYEARTDADGRFVLSDVAGGSYELEVEAPGFSRPRKTLVTVREGATETSPVTLEVAALSDRLLVTATRTETPSIEVGGASSVVTDDDLKLANQSLISEALRLTPGMAVVRTGGRGGITSVFVRGGESDYNKVMIDGVPVNNAGGAFDFQALTPENIERVEIVRGPGSALFGSDAMTSSIQLFTRRGTTSIPEFELSGEGGSLEYHRETARLSGAVDWFDYSTSFGFQSTDGRFQNSDFINRSGSANLGFRLGPDASLRVTSRLNNNTLGVPGPVAVLFPDPDQRQKHRDISAAATLDFRTTSRWQHTGRFIYAESDTNSFDSVAQDLRDPATPPLPPGAFGDDFQFFFREHQRRAGFQYQTIAALGSNNVFTAGLDFDHESADFTSDFSTSSPTRNNVGFYFQDQAAWRDRLFVTAGLRVEYNSANLPDDFRAALDLLGSTAPDGDVGFGFAVNPKIAASFIVRRHQEGSVGATRLRGSYGLGIKEPRFDEAFSPSTFFLGNPLLDPERVRAFDFGVEQEFWGRRLSVEASYFDNRFRDIIVFRSDPLTFGPIELPDGRLASFINLDRASARGLELIGTVQPLRKLRLIGSYTFLRSRVEEAGPTLSPEVGLPLLRRPRHSGTFEVSWIDERFDVKVDGSALGKRRDIDPVFGSRFDLAGNPFFNDGYIQMNAAGSYRITRRVAAFARIDNLLNQDYEEVLGFPANRFQITGGVRIRIGGNR